MKHTPPFLTQHRFARLIAWLCAMLAWAAATLFANTTRPKRRHIRQRYAFLSLDYIERLVRELIIVRAADLTHLGARPRLCFVRNRAARGFRRRTARGAMLRSIAGSRLRKALKRRDPAQHLQVLFAALASIDALARRYLLPRAQRRLTRLFPILMFAPPAAALSSLAAPAPHAADSS